MHIDITNYYRQSSVVCRYITIMVPAKTTHLNKMPFRIWNWVSPWNHVGLGPHIGTGKAKTGQPRTCSMIVILSRWQRQ